MKLNTLQKVKITVMTCLILVNSRTFPKSRRRVKEWNWPWEDTKEDFKLNILEDPSESKYVNSFFIGVISTVGIKEAAEIKFILNKIFDDGLATSFQEEGKAEKYICDKNGLFKYVKDFSITTMSKDKQLKYNSCKEEIGIRNRRFGQSI